MAEHKVPQDVEAEDKLIGPLSFRQFIYAMIALAATALAYFLATKIAMPMVVIPLPVVLVFGVLAIPRKGQPMEIYVGALIHFYFYPTKRIWNPDGQESLVEITNLSIDNTPQIKDISGAEAAQRLSFLAGVVDTQGWSTRGNVNLYDDYALEANSAQDVFEDALLNQEFSAKLAAAEQRARNDAIAHMRTVTAPTESRGFAPPTATPPPAVITPPPMPVEDEATLSAMLKQSSSQGMTSFKQTVVQPLDTPPVADDSTPPPAPERSIMETPEETESAQTPPQTRRAIEVPARRTDLDDNQSGEISLH